eukprot:12595960-Alexandrium_andersonii.AAC.1
MQMLLNLQRTNTLQAEHPLPGLVVFPSRASQMSSESLPAPAPAPQLCLTALRAHPKMHLPCLPPLGF